ncbi:MAG: hypothetical protein L0H93_07205, partial [Nocardioides sp.]|nr:hypothetical protein [Nocardioides sp.]
DSGAHAGPAASEVVPLPEFVRVCAEARGSLTIDDYDVTDPIGGSTGVFDEVAALLDGELGTLAAALIAASGSLPSDPDRATS